MLRVPLSITAESGTVSTGVLAPTCSSMWANIAGLSSCRGLASSTRTGTVRVSAFSVGYTYVTRPSNAWFGYAPIFTFALAPILMRPISCSNTSAITQTDDRSVTWYSISPGMKRMPCSAFFSVTTPDTGEANVIVRVAWPVATKALTCSAENSQLRRRARLACANCCMPLCASAPASFIAATPCIAIMYSRCAATSSGL